MSGNKWAMGTGAALVAIAFLLISGPSRDSAGSIECLHGDYCIDSTLTFEKVDAPVVLFSGAYEPPQPTMAGDRLFVLNSVNSKIDVYLGQDLIKSISLPMNHFFRGIGVFDAKLSRFYIVLPPGETEPTQRRAVVGIDVNDYSFDTKYMEPIEFFPNTRFGPKILRRFYCQTMPVVERDPLRLSFGCSVRARPELGDNYAEVQGMTGRIVSLFLNADGTFSDVPPRILPTSRPVPGSILHGFDTGVYQARGPAFSLEDGSTIWTTGNGYVDFQNRNYGCSVIRVKGESVVDAHSMDAQRSVECWSKNYEYSSSTYASATRGLSDYGGVYRKDGVFEIFQNGNLGKGPVWSEKLGQFFQYGRMATFKRAGKFHFIVRSERSMELNRASFTSDLKFVPYPGFREVSNEVAGYLPALDEGNEKWSLYYSGFTRDEYVVLKSKPALETDNLAARGAIGKIPDTDWGFGGKFYPVFKYRADLGAIWSEKVIRSNSNCFQDLNKMDFKIGIDRISAKDPVMVLREECRESFVDQTLVPVYLKKFQKLQKSGVLVTSITGDDAGFKQDWQIHFKDHGAFRDHMALWVNGDHAYVGFSMLNYLTQKSKLLIVNALTSEIVSETEFEGTPHFSAPVLYSDAIWLPTQEGKMLRFQVKR